MPFENHKCFSSVFTTSNYPLKKLMSNPIYKGGKSLARGGKWVDPKAVVIVRIVAVCTHSH